MVCKNYAYYPNLLRGYAFFNKPLFVLDDPRHSIAEKRWAAFGTTDTGRLLVVVFTKRGNLLRVISASESGKNLPRQTNCPGT
ncbi:MAG: BrnT family toxin [Deltaproteobacteria bacterium]|nr:BrnT family toxin [Deltaproteobacteria bacterium]